MLEESSSRQENPEGILQSTGLAGFRQRVRQKITEGKLTGDQRLELLAEAVDFDLEYDEAKRVLEEMDQVLASPASVDAAIQKYRDAYQRFWEQDQGSLTPDHRAYLRGLQKKLRLTEEQVQMAEEQVRTVRTLITTKGAQK